MSERGWVTSRRRCRKPARKGIELNVYYIPTEMYRTGAQVEQQYLDVAGARSSPP